MFESLTDRLNSTLRNIRGVGRLTETNIHDTLRDVRRALLEADVALPVVQQFVEQVTEQALGQEVMKSLTPGQELVRVVRDQLTELLGSANDGLDLTARPPAVVLLAGLQGSGKTTSAAKLAKRLTETQAKKVMLVSCDVYRPAAIDQLRKLASEVGATFHESSPDQRPLDIASGALDAARRSHIDVLIVDTAGRLHVDSDMMDEVKALHAALDPVETLFVVDAMTGQDAARTAKAFDEALALTGVILTKADGDARGGAALSIRHITGKPIKFIGMGEKVDALDPFHPERIASRILGMGDVMSLIEDAEQKVDRDKAEKIAAKLRKGKGFDMEDLRDQIVQMRNMGGVASLLDKLPGASELTKEQRAQVNDGELLRTEAIINSMTPHERRRPAVINGSRKRRIATGSGTRIQDVNKVLKQVTQMQKMMKRMKRNKGGFPGLGGLGGLGGGGGPGGLGGGRPPF
ncbi:MAG: signal recognition particle protein [Chromatiales bacterium]|nr:signal recognition particle protein [Chromatiales bacterium]